MKILIECRGLPSQRDDHVELPPRFYPALYIQQNPG